MAQDAGETLKVATTTAKVLNNKKAIKAVNQNYSFPTYKVVEQLISPKTERYLSYECKNLLSLSIDSPKS